MQRILSRIIILILVLWLTGCSANPLPAQSYSPTISISPTTGTPGSEIFVHGGGFSANEAGITITYDGIIVDAQSYGQGYVSSRISANAQGGWWRATFVVPASPSGSHIIDASSPSTLATTVPDVTFTVTPDIDITGIHGISRTSEAAGRSVTVTGRGFSANETGITVTYNHIPIVSGISANSEGSWSAIFVAPTADDAYGPTIRAYGSITQEILRPPLLTVPPPPPRPPERSFLWLIIGIILGAAILTLVFIREKLSATSRRGLAKGIRWTARVIGVGGTLVYLFAVFAAWSFSDPFILSSEGVIFSRATLVIALAGCVISWWREWLAGVLLIISWVTPLGVVIYGIVMGRHYDVSEWLGFSSLLTVVGLLFLLSWWLTRKTDSSALPLSPTQKQKEPAKRKSIPAFALWGAVGFGIGGAIGGIMQFVPPPFFGLAIIGGIGGMSLGLALNSWKMAGFLALAGAVGLSIGFFISIGLGPGQVLPLPYLLWRILGRFTIAGVVAGAVLGLHFESWKAAGFLALAGAIAFRIAEQVTRVVSFGYQTAPLLSGVTLMVIWGVIAGALLGAALGYLEKRKAKSNTNTKE